MFSDEDDESVLTEMEKNGISDGLKTIDSSKNNCVSGLDILQDHVIGEDIINDSNDVMDISIHGDFSNHQNENFKISGPDSLTSLLDPELILALPYKETKEVQTSFPVKNVTEVSIQVKI